jgi:uroporphyrinogen decarboxylase
MIMTPTQWQQLLDISSGVETANPPLTGFIIDSPWIPGWAGISHIRYYASDHAWMAANRKAIQAFPDTIFLPGFWSEYGMCLEPSAFGARCIWNESGLPYAEKIIHDVSDIDRLTCPDPASDGLLPFMIQRLKSTLEEIQAMGHEVKFAVSRGPLNIASFLMGTTELMTAIMLQPDKVHHLLRLITDFTISWIRLQRKEFSDVEGIFILDDIVGFLGNEECQAFAMPYLKEIFDSFPARIRFFHNDANGLICAPFLPEMNVNIFNFSFEHSIDEIRNLTGSDVVLLGNIPPRDVLASGSSGEVSEKTREMWDSTSDKSRVIWSCGGGMPPDVPTENIRMFINTISSMI